MVYRRATEPHILGWSPSFIICFSYFHFLEQEWSFNFDSSSSLLTLYMEIIFCFMYVYIFIFVTFFSCDLFPVTFFRYFISVTFFPCDFFPSTTMTVTTISVMQVKRTGAGVEWLTPVPEVPGSILSRAPFVVALSKPLQLLR